MTNPLPPASPPVSQRAIAHIMPWSGMGGVEIATLRLVAATRDRFRHVAFCLPDAFELQQAFAALGAEVVVYREATPSLRHGLRFWRESRQISDALRRAEIDIVHFSETKAAQHNSLAARMAGVRLLSHVRVSQPELPLRQRLTMLPVHRFLFVSEEARKTFALSLPESRAAVIYDAVEQPTLDIEEANRSVRAEFAIPFDVPVVGMIARVSPQKDYFTLAEAAVKVLGTHPATRFLIIGDNSLVALNRDHYQLVRQRLEALGIAVSFIFTGHRGDVSRLTCAADLCILPTHREGFPLSILEAMSLGKPVIATAVGGIPEIVAPGVNGFLHQHGDSGELADAICRLIEDPALRLRLGAAALAQIRSEYDVETYRQRITEIYDQA